MLYLIPTPVGNLSDITFRSLEILKTVDLILAEDTRHFGKLKKHFEIDTPTRSYHSHNEHRTVDQIISELSAGTSMALVTDAGTPGISDPGFLLARACHDAQIKVVALPGATAFVPALVASGLPSDKFFFEGFLPTKKGRQTRLKFLSEFPHSFILYESPFRLVKCLKELIEHCGEQRMACVAREITKMHEEITTATLPELLEKYTAIPKVKGEIVIVVAGKT